MKQATGQQSVDSSEDSKGAGAINRAMSPLVL